MRRPTRRSILWAALVLGIAILLWSSVISAVLLYEHNGDIHRIEELTQEVRTTQLQNRADIQKTTSLVDTLNASVREQTKNHTETAADLAAICRATPGCVLPPPGAVATVVPYP